MAVTTRKRTKVTKPEPKAKVTKAKKATKDKVKVDGPSTERIKEGKAQINLWGVEAQAANDYKQMAADKGVKNSHFFDRLVNFAAEARRSKNTEVRKLVKKHDV